MVGDCGRWWEMVGGGGRWWKVVGDGGRWWEMEGDRDAYRLEPLGIRKDDEAKLDLARCAHLQMHIGR